MYSLYMTSESESKLNSVYSNIKNFYILDVQKFIKSLGLDMTKQSSVFLVNDEIEKTIIAQSKLKKYKGIIYINKSLSAETYSAFRTYFSKLDEPIKFILIDNNYLPKHKDIMSLFDQVIFYERFRKTKIIECEGFIKLDLQKKDVDTVLMDENEYDD